MQISPVVSDLATQKSLLQRGSAVRAQMQTASQEMSSGLKSDLVAATGGDLGGLFAIERGIVQLDSQIEGLNFAAAKASSAENYLGQLAAGVAPFGVDLQAALDRGDALAQTSIAKGARAAFDAAVSALNGRYGRHALFAGAALDGPALVDSDAIYADLAALASGAANGLDAIAAIDSYFNATGGWFETGAYLGGDTTAPGVEIAEGQRLNYALRADDAAFRQNLQALALVALAAEGDTPGTPADARLMLREGAALALENPGQILALREGLGHAAQRIDETIANASGALHGLELRRAAIVSADPYETASAFQALQGQMEIIYEVTARMANLRLVDRLR
tara:strand:+ start:354 stop:1367 length:1014 start_codon:yes stop_codon:yes gene_type:complete